PTPLGRWSDLDPLVGHSDGVHRHRIDRRAPDGLARPQGELALGAGAPPGPGSTAGPPTGSPVARSNSLWWQGHTTVSSWSPSVPSASEHPSWVHSSPNANSSFSTCAIATRRTGRSKERSSPSGTSASDPTRRYISSTPASSLKERRAAYARLGAATASRTEG